MPVNEILAQSYVKFSYTTTSARHDARLYFSQPVTALNDPNGDFAFTLGRDGQNVAGYSVRDVVDEVVERRKSDWSIVSVDSIEMWEGDGPNSLLGYITPLGAIAQAVNARVASGYTMWVMGPLSGGLFRFQLFEAGDARPQRFVWPNTPAVDDGTLEWLFLKSNVPFSTNDGLSLTRGLSINVGYNRKLARNYGRQQTP